MPSIKSIFWPLLLNHLSGLLFAIMQVYLSSPLHHDAYVTVRHFNSGSTGVLEAPIAEFASYIGHSVIPPCCELKDCAEKQFF